MVQPNWKLVAQKYMMLGLFGGKYLICFSAVGTYYLAVWLNEDEEPVHMVRIMKYTDLLVTSVFSHESKAGACRSSFRSGSEAKRPVFQFPCPMRKSARSRQLHHKQN